MRASLVLAALAANLVFIESPIAATVEPIVGEVLVNQGDGFKPLPSSASANIEQAAGSQIMVRPGGSALITYAANCSLRVPSGIWVVKEASPCAEGTSLIDFTGRMNQEAPPPDGDTTMLIVGGLVVAGGVAAAIALSQDSGDNPASP